MRITGRIAATFVAAAALGAPAVIAPAAPPVAPAEPATPAAQLLLAQGEFPAGYAVEPISRTELDTVLRDVGDGVAGARITPAHCRAGINRTELDKSAQVPVVVAVNKQTRSALSEVLTSATGPKTEVSPAPGCERVRVEVDRVGGTNDRMALDVTTTMTHVPDAPAGARIATVHSVGTATVDGRPTHVDQEQLLGVSVVRGYSVIVSGSTFGPGQKIDRAAFGKTLTAATDKVRRAK